MDDRRVRHENQAHVSRVLFQGRREIIERRGDPAVPVAFLPRPFPEFAANSHQTSALAAAWQLHVSPPAHPTYGGGPVRRGGMIVRKSGHGTPRVEGPCHEHENAFG